jgi:hypothetical protein
LPQSSFAGITGYGGCDKSSIASSIVAASFSFATVPSASPRVQGVQCYAVVAIVPDRDGKDWVPSEVILDTAQNYLAASINRLALIASLEDVFARVQVFGTELALARTWIRP